MESSFDTEGTKLYAKNRQKRKELFRENEHKIEIKTYQKVSLRIIMQLFLWLWFKKLQKWFGDGLFYWKLKTSILQRKNYRL